MSAYTNPPLIIDTQTSEHFRNLQRTIAESFSGVARSYIERQEEIKKKLEENAKRIDGINKAAEKSEFELRNDVAKLSNETGQINLAETFEPLIQKAKNLNLGLLNNTITGQERQKAMQSLVDIKNTVSGSFSQSLGDIAGYAEDVTKALQIPRGMPGGIADDMKADDLDAIFIMQGKLNGYKKAVFKDSDENKLVWQIYKGEGEKSTLVAEYSASQLKKMSDLGVEFVKIVPDRSANNESLKTANPEIFELESTNSKDPNATMQSTGRITDTFLEKNPDGTLKTTEVEVGAKGSGVYKNVVKVNLDEIKKRTDFILDSQIAGMTPDELILHTNNTVKRYREAAGLPITYLDGENILDEKVKKYAIDAYKDHFYNTQIAREQDILKEDSSVYTYTKEGTGASKGASTSTGGSRSATQIFHESVFETPPAERERSGVGKGTIVKGPTKRYKIADENDIKASKKGKVGYWYEIDNYGALVGSPVSEDKVKKQIGYKKQ